MRISDWSSDVCSSDLRRFRIQYGSEGIGADGEGQGNVQTIFVGAFDTVAALRSNIAGLVVLAALAGLGAVGAWIGDAGPWWLKVTALGVAIWLAWRFVRDYLPLRFFIPDDVTALPIWHPRRWLAGLGHAHIALGSGQTSNWKSGGEGKRV